MQPRASFLRKNILLFNWYSDNEDVCLRAANGRKERAAFGDHYRAVLGKKDKAKLSFKIVKQWRLLNFRDGAPWHTFSEKKKLIMAPCWLDAHVDLPLGTTWASVPTSPHFGGPVHLVMVWPGMLQGGWAEANCYWRVGFSWDRPTSTNFRIAVPFFFLLLDLFSCLLSYARTCSRWKWHCSFPFSLEVYLDRLRTKLRSIERLIARGNVTEAFLVCIDWFPGLTRSLDEPWSHAGAQCVLDVTLRAFIIVRESLYYRGGRYSEIVPFACSFPPSFCTT